MAEVTKSTIAKNLAEIERNISSYKQPALIAVSKRQPLERVIAYCELCKENKKICILGENYVQEWQEKRAELLAINDELESHLIGPLQRNKAKTALEIFNLIQAVGKLELLLELEKQTQQEYPVLLQINISQDQAKSGFTVDEVTEILSTNLALLKKIRICGLMAIPKEERDQSLTKSYFRALRQLRDQLRASFSNHQHSFSELSMGMSSDYRLALDEGATIIRVGSALFGERGY